MNVFVVYTDGGADPNPGPGGYGAIICNRHAKPMREFFQGFTQTTNNRMEFRGAIAALASIEERSIVTVFTDSKLLVNTANTWIHAWHKNGWQRSKARSFAGPLKNLDLLKLLHEQLKRHQCVFKWVRGHNGDPLNERCDELTWKARDKKWPQLEDIYVAEGCGNDTGNPQP